MIFGRAIEATIMTKYVKRIDNDGWTLLNNKSCIYHIAYYFDGANYGMEEIWTKNKSIFPDEIK